MRSKSGSTHSASNSEKEPTMKPATKVQIKRLKELAKEAEIFGVGHNYRLNEFRLKAGPGQVLSLISKIEQLETKAKENSHASSKE